MKRLCPEILLFLAFTNGFAWAQRKLDPLPIPVSNNAVAGVKAKGYFLYSFMGIGAKKTWDAVTNNAYALDLATGKWSPINPVPGPAGRIAASAIGARGLVYLFGGYTVDAHGGEITVPDVEIYEPLTGRWFRGPDIPVPVDDSVVGVYRDRYIYLVSGWSNHDAVSNVQVYDAEKNKWFKATPIPGTPVFAHAGGLVDDTIVYVDGARKSTGGAGSAYVASDECWMGKIDHKHPEQIQWTKLPNHPGLARFRIAAGVGGEGSGEKKEEKIYFSGGSDNPYSFNGIGYDGNPAEPSAVTFDFNLRTKKWETIDENTPDPTMDHRGLVVTPDGLAVIGGMEKGQQVTAKVVLLPKGPKATK